MVGEEADAAAVPGRWWVADWSVGDGRLPEDGATQVRHPPDAGVLLVGPEVGVPAFEDFAEWVQGLGPGDADLGHGAEGEFDDDAEGAEGEQGCAEEGQVVGCAAADELAVGEDEGEGCDGLAEEAVVEGGAVGPRGNGAGDGLDVDAAKVGDGEAVLGEFEAEVMQREAGFEGDEVGGRVDVEDAVKVVEVHHPG